MEEHEGWTAKERARVLGPFPRLTGTERPIGTLLRDSEGGGQPNVAALIGSRGTLVRGCRGQNALCPPEACLVERRLKERVSRRGHRVVCPHTNPQGLRSER